MCDIHGSEMESKRSNKTIPIAEAVGMVLAHDITEIRKDEFKGPAFRKGHVIRREDICHLQRIGKERLFVLSLGPDEVHEDDAARELARALMGEGVTVKGEPREGKVTIIASRDGLLRIDKDALKAFNMLGEVMCATLHTNTTVKKGQEVAGTRAIPLVIKRAVVDEAVRRAESAKKVTGTRNHGDRGTRMLSPETSHGTGTIAVREIRKPRAGVVITGNEVYHGRVKDAFAPIIARKIEELGGAVVGTYYAPDDEHFIAGRLRELIDAGADLLITTGGMSVDPDDMTRFAIKSLGATDIAYGSAVLPGAMVLVGYIQKTDDRGQRPDTIRGSGSSPSSDLCAPASDSIPILGIPACGMYHTTTVFDLILPRILSGERIGREALAELGHGGLCLHCKECRYPVCPFGK